MAVSLKGSEVLSVAVSLNVRRASHFHPHLGCLSMLLLIFCGGNLHQAPKDDPDSRQQVETSHFSFLLVSFPLQILSVIDCDHHLLLFTPHLFVPLLLLDTFLSDYVSFGLLFMRTLLSSCLKLFTPHLFHFFAALLTWTCFSILLAHFQVPFKRYCARIKVQI